MKGITHLINRLKRLDEGHVEYGYFETDVHTGSGKSMAELAGLLNDGYKNTPARPFVDDGIDLNNKWLEVNNTWRNDLLRYLRYGGPIKSFYSGIGKQGVLSIQTKIDVNDYVDNIKWWEDLKTAKYGSSQVLVETNELYQGAKFKVIKGGK